MNTLDNPTRYGLPTLAELRRRYAQGELIPSQCVTQLLDRIDQVDRPEIDRKSVV